MAPVSQADKAMDRKALRRASALLDEAGWTVGDGGLRRNAKGEVLKLEFIEDSPAFERVISPYVENLRALGVDAQLVMVDSAQLSARIDPPSFDFDIIVGNAVNGGYEPGAELKQAWASVTKDNSSRNRVGFAMPAVDRLLDMVEAAKTRDELDVVVQALDRVLRAQKFWVPQWYKNAHTVAYYDMYEHPETLPPFDLGELDFWWLNPEKEAALRAAGALK
jgi:microcin C transport system substrate-binding protein